MINVVCQDVLKALKTQQTSSNLNDQANNSFAGNALMASSFIALSNTVMLNTISWMVDTGASDHVTAHAQLFSSMKPEKSSVIRFPDGHTKAVSYIGNIKINSEFELNDVLYVLDFKHNQLLVSKILSDSSLVTYFTVHGFLL